MKNSSRIKGLLEDASGGAVQENVPLCRHTSFHIGGPAAFFAEASSLDSLSALLRVACEQALPTLVLGGGTNLLVSDLGFEGLAIRLTLDELDIDGDQGLARVGAGAPTSLLVERAVSFGLAGLAFAAGLPGTVGGGLSGNAGCFGSCLGDVLKSATVVSPKGEITVIRDVDWFSFGYRHSSVPKNGFVIAEAVFALSKGDREQLQRQAEKHLALRREKHPSKETFTAGSFFKNLTPSRQGERRRAAGLLLDQVGARDLSVGDAAVFERHANIIINRGRATAEEVLTLAREMKRRVKARFDIDLTPEVRFVGERPKNL